MKFRDRLTGGELSELPNFLLSGRYFVLESIVLNGHSDLKSGDLLLDDGSGVIQIDSYERKIDSIKQSDEDQTHSDLLAEAINAIAGKIAHAGQSPVSPMLPAELAAQCELDEFEKILANTLRNGHLHSISDRPRRDLRYDDLVAPVARARRLATSALTHLASHSDCWQQRTLSGIQPRKILARFSEDDYVIYENRLYKRLLDRLDRYLTRRLARIRGVNSRLEKALKFQDSEQTHFRLRQDICRLWGESYLDDNTGMRLEAGKHTLSELESQLRAIRGLKQRGLYSLVPAAAVVPSQIHRTNILNHDPHYRHLPILWEKLQDEREDRRQLAPKERLKKHQQLQLAYGSYVGLVLRRALERYGLQNAHREHMEFIWAGRTFSIQQDNQDWLVVDTTPINGSSDEDTLRLIPIAWFGKFIEEGDCTKSGYVVCWPGHNDSIASDHCLPVSPLDLYVVEKIGRLVDEWILAKLVKGYAKKLGPLPTPVKQLTDEWPENFKSFSSTHTRLLAPLDAKKFEEIELLLKKSANSEVKNAVLTAIEQLNILARLCGHTADFEANFDQGFYCRCRTCETTWSLRTSGKKKVFSMRPKGASNISSADGFNWSGRDWLDFSYYSNTP